MPKKIFSKIQNKIILGFVLLIFLPFLLITFIYFNYLFKQAESNAFKDISRKLEAKKERLENYLKNIRLDCQLLSDLPFFKMKFQADDFNFPEIGEFWRERIEEVFLTFSKTKNFYSQIRYINQNGKETIRINSENNHKVVVVKKENLRNKKERYYFKKAMKIAPGKIYISNVDLNREKGEIELPHRPVIRYAASLFNEQGKPRGIVIINISLNLLFAEIIENDIYPKTYQFADDQGYYIYHSNPAKLWGGPLDLKTEEGIKRDYPLYSKQILSGKRGRFITEKEIFVYTPVFFDPANKNRFWVAFARQKKSEVFTVINYFKNIFSLISLIILLSILILAIAFSRYISKPIRLLEEGARKISAGESGLQVEIKSDDEIGSLAHSFNEMSKKIKERNLSLKKSETKYRNLSQNLEKMVETRTEELRKSQEELKDFAYITSHDLRSPLINISGFSLRLRNTIEKTASKLKELLKSRNTSPPGCKEKIDNISAYLIKDAEVSLKYIHASVKKMDSLITGILKLSRITRVENVYSEINLLTMLQKTLGTFKFQLEEKKIKVILKDLPLIYADEEKIEEVFSNLIHNAIQYSNDSFPYIEIGYFERNYNYRFYVKDNGIGIAEKNKDKIFQIFTQLRERETDGYGIGLTLVKKILEKHQGTIWVESEKGKGTTFWFELPRKVKV